MKAVITVENDVERVSVARMLMQAMNATCFYPTLGERERDCITDLMCKLRDSIKVKETKK